MTHIFDEGPFRPWQLRSTRVGRYAVSTIDRHKMPQWVNDAGGYDLSEGRFETASYVFDDTVGEPVRRVMSELVVTALQAHEAEVDRLAAKPHDAE